MAVWLGTDIGVFLAGRQMRNASLPMETRRAMGQLSGMVDMGPRSALVLVLMLGITLSYLGQWGFTGAGGNSLRVVIAGSLALVAVYSLLTDGPIRATWLCAKLILFAGIVACGVGIRVVLPKTRAALMEIFIEGSTAEREARLGRSGAPLRAFVLGIWSLIVLIIWISVSKG